MRVAVSDTEVEAAIRAMATLTAREFFALTDTRPDERSIAGAGTALALPALGVDLRPEDIYEGVDL